MKNMKVRALADGAICTALTILLTIIAIYVPAFAFFSVAVVGIPLMYIGVKHGLSLSLVSGAASILLLFILTGEPLTAILYGVINMLPGIAIGYTVNKKKSFGLSVTASSAAVLLGLMLQLLVINISGGGNGIANLIDGSIEMAREAFNTIAAEFTSVNPEQGSELVSVLNSAFEVMRESIFLYMPSFVIGAAAVMGYAAYMFGIFVLKRMRIANIYYLPFNQIHASRTLCNAAVLLMIFTTFADTSSTFVAAIKNMETLMFAYICVAGLAIVDYKLSGKIKSGYGRVGIYIAVFIVGYLMLGFITRILMFIGLLDGVFNFRRLRKAGDDGVKHS